MWCNKFGNAPKLKEFTADVRGSRCDCGQCNGSVFKPIYPNGTISLQRRLRDIIVLGVIQNYLLHFAPKVA